MQLRVATSADSQAMWQVEQAATAYPWTQGLFDSSFSERYFNAVLLWQQQIVGFYIGEFIAGEASLFNIAVHPSMQGKGFGKALLNDFLQQAEQRDASSCWLEVRASNQTAIGLYQQSGFHQVGVRPGYYPAANGKEDAILMALSFTMPAL